mgnify:FL=1
MLKKYILYFLVVKDQHNLSTTFIQENEMDNRGHGLASTRWLPQLSNISSLRFAEGKPCKVLSFSLLCLELQPRRILIAFATLKESAAMIFKRACRKFHEKFCSQMEHNLLKNITK